MTGPKDRQARKARQTTVALRFAGPHEVDTERYRDMVRVYMPGAVITLMDMEAAKSVDRIWRAATAAKTSIFNGERAGGYYPIPGSTVWVSVNLHGRIVGREIQGKTPPHSRSKCGELRVRIADLVIIMDDRDAAESQLRAWNQAITLSWKVFRNLG